MQKIVWLGLGNFIIFNFFVVLKLVSFLHCCVEFDDILNYVIIRAQHKSVGGEIKKQLSSKGEKYDFLRGSNELDMLLSLAWFH